MQTYNVLVLLGLAFVWSPADAQYALIQTFVENCEAGWEDPDCPDLNVTDDSMSAYSNFVSIPEPGHRVQRSEESNQVWRNPCSNPPSYFNELIASKNLVVDGSKEFLMQNLINQANFAHLYADELKKQFVPLTFEITFEEFHHLWQHICFYRLPSVDYIPKSLGIKLNWSYLRGILKKEDKTLESCFRYLQYYSFTMRKITTDLNIDPNSLTPEQQMKRKFVFVEYHLKAVICEMQAVLYEYRLDHVIGRYVPPLYFPTGDLPNLSPAFISVRVWLLFRDYISFLEYLKEVIDLYLTKIQIKRMHS